MTKQVSWFRVFVEGVVIVGSILLAFGIDAWWERTQQRKAADLYQQALIADLESDLAQLQEGASTADARAESARRVMSAVQRGAAVVEDPEQLVADLILAGFSTSPEYSTSTYTELLSAGRLELIGDATVRRHVIEYYEHLEYWADAERDWRDAVENGIGTLPERVLRPDLYVGGLDVIRGHSLRNGLWSDGVPPSDQPAAIVSRLRAVEELDRFFARALAVRNQQARLFGSHHLEQCEQLIALLRGSE